jgi:spore coat protein U-like protein
MCANEPGVGASPPSSPCPPAPRRRAVRALSLAAAVALGAWGAPARALCFPPSAQALRFGAYAPFGAGTTASTSVSVVCLLPLGSVTISISSPRELTAGAERLPFELFTDAAMTTVFPGAPGVAIPNAGIIVSIKVPVWGFIAPRQDAAAGSYNATLTVTIFDGATSSTTSLPVSAQVTGACEIQAGTLAFGAYDPAATAPRDVGGTISVMCTRGTPYTVLLGPGTYAAGATRQMAGPGRDRLQYELYSDPARTAVWNATPTVGGIAPSVDAIPLPVYGRIPARQLVQAGGYSDVVQSTINF